MTASAIRARYGIVDGREPLASSLDALGNDDELVSLLTAAVNVDLPLERYLTRVRAILLDACGEAGRTGSTRRLAAAIALQGHLNEYIWPESDDERAQVEHLYARLGAPAPIDAAADRALACAMYRLLPPPLATTAAAGLSAHGAEELARLFIQRTVDEPAAELALRRDVIALGPEPDPRSRVRRQYEENPTPRWVTPPRPQPPLDACLRTRGARPHQPDGPVRILVAGCGTGQHPLRLARSNPDADILAIDVSVAALAYAQRMANRFGATGIAFRHADLLALSPSRRFDHIECIGVLQTLEDPGAAWPALAEVLRPNGTVRVSVYSRAARLLVAHLRDRFRSERQHVTAATIRAVRHQVLHDPTLAAALPQLSANPDFYSASQLRNLLLHESEHQFTVAEIDASTSAAGLRLVGVDLPPGLTALIRQRWPQIALPLQSFADWRRVETAFAGSQANFVFWLQAPG